MWGTRTRRWESLRVEELGEARNPDLKLTLTLTLILTLPYPTLNPRATYVLGDRPLVFCRRVDRGRRDTLEAQA